MLCSFDQNVNKQNELLRAVHRGKIKVVEYLIKTGCDIDAKDQKGNTALDIAIHKGYTEIIELLTKNKTNINNRDKNNQAQFSSNQSKVISSPRIEKLFDAVVDGDFEYVKEAIKLGINIKNKSGNTPLILAAYNNHKEIVRFLITSGADVNVKDRYNNTILHIVANEGLIEVTKLLIEGGADVNAINQDSGGTPLFLATWKGHLAIVKLLIENGANVDIRDREGNPVLHFAVYNGHKEIVEYLIKTGCNTDAKGQKGSTVLDIATQRDHIEIVELLTKNETDIDNNNHCTLLNSYQSEATLPEITIELFSAATDGDFEYVEYAVELGVDVNTQNEYGSTPLFLSACGGHAEIVEFLIKSGAKVNSINDIGATPLIAAAFSGHLEIVEYLIKNEADVNIKGQYSNTALHLATYENHIKVVEVLIRNGANINAKKQNGHLALHLAAYGGHIEVTKLLVENGTDIDATNQSGDTPLILAVQEGHLEVVKLLIKSKADVGIRDQEDNTILHFAAHNSHEKLVEFLIERKFDINAKKQGGYAPLHTAAQIGNIEILKLLIENGADINITNNDDCKPIHIAALGGQKEALEFLKSKNTSISEGSDDGKLFHVIKYESVLENSTKSKEYDELFEQSGSNTLNYITPSHIFKIPFVVEMFKKNIKLTDLSKRACVLFSNFISLFNFNKEDFNKLYNLMNSNYRELNEENFKKFLEDKLESKKTKEIFEFVQAIVEYFPILNTGNAVCCSNCDNLLPQELLARDISGNEYSMEFYKTVINKPAILGILKNLERESTILCIVVKISKDEIDHTMSITKTYKGRYIFSDINKPNVLEFSSEEEVCDVIELASNKYYKGINCFPGIELINSTKTVKKVIEHYALKHKMYESKNNKLQTKLQEFEGKNHGISIQSIYNLEGKLEEDFAIEKKPTLMTLQQEDRQDNKDKDVSGASSEVSTSDKTQNFLPQRLSSVIEENNQLRKQVTQLISDLSSAKQAIEALQSNKDELEREISDLQAQYKGVNQKVLKLEQEKLSQRARIDDLTKEKKQFAKKKEEISELNNQVTKLTEENTKLENELKLKKPENNDLKTKLQKSENKSKGLGSQIENLQKQLESKDKELNGKSKKFSKASTQSRKQGNYASASFILSGMFAVGASLTIPYLATCIALAVAASVFLAIGCCCLYKANTALSNVEVDQATKSTNPVTV